MHECAKGIHLLLMSKSDQIVSHSLLWVQEMNLRVEDVSVCVCVCVSRLTFGHTLDVKHGTPFCVVFASLSTWKELVQRKSTFFLCRKGIKCLSFWIKQLSNIGAWAGLGPTKVGKVPDTYGRLRNKVVFSFESEARHCHHARTKSLLILRLERFIGRFAGFSAV